MLARCNRAGFLASIHHLQAGNSAHVGPSNSPRGEGFLHRGAGATALFSPWMLPGFAAFTFIARLAPGKRQDYACSRSRRRGALSGAQPAPRAGSRARLGVPGALYPHSPLIASACFLLAGATLLPAFLAFSPRGGPDPRFAALGGLFAWLSGHFLLPRRAGCKLDFRASPSLLE